MRAVTRQAMPIPGSPSAARIAVDAMGWIRSARELAEAGGCLLSLWATRPSSTASAMVRAAVDNRAMAQSVGIDTRRLFALTFALGSGLAGLGGALGAEIIAVQPTYPFEHLVYFLIVVAVGGLGSLRGPFAAALLIGVTDTACKYWLPQFGAFFIYAATIGVLLLRPAGLFGTRT